MPRLLVAGGAALVEGTVLFDAVEDVEEELVADELDVDGAESGLPLSS